MLREMRIRRNINSEVHENESVDASANKALAALALAQAEQNKVRRTAVKWILRPVGAIAVVAASAQLLGSCGDKLDWFKDGVKHDDVQMTPHNALEEVSLPNEAILVRGKGTGTAEVQTRPESDMPGIGDLYNATIAKWSDEKTIVGKEGEAQVIARRGAITLKPYELPERGKDGEKKYGVRAIVDINKLDTQKDMDSARDPNGDVSVDIDDDWLANNKAEDYAKRALTVGDAAAVGYENECSKLLDNLLPAGVMVHVHDQLISTSKLLEATDRKGSQEASALLKEMSPIDNIKVDLVKYHVRNGVRQTTEADVNSIRFPAQKKYTKAKLAKDLGVKPHNLRVTPSGMCTPKGRALDQYYKLLDKASGKKSPDLDV